MTTPTAIYLTPDAAKQLRYCVVRLNAAADHIVPSLAGDYETWGFLHQAVDEMTTPCSGGRPPLREPAFYFNLAVDLRQHHDHIQQSLIAGILPAARGVHVRDQLITAAKFAYKLGEIISKPHLERYHHVISASRPHDPVPA